MGEYVGLCIGNYEFLSCKNSFGDLLSIYSPDDLNIEEVFDPEINETITRRYFTTTVNKAKMCLDVMGHTLSEAKRLFEYHKRGYLGYLDYLRYNYHNEVDIEHIEKNYTFENWVMAVKKYSLVLAYDIYKDGEYISLEKCKQEKISLCEKLVLKSLPHWADNTYFGVDFCYSKEDIGSPWDVFRVILDAFKPEDIITLDYTNLFEGGWCTEVPDKEEYLVPRTVILTEGKTDTRVISQAMELLYPHMMKFYSFIDFSTFGVQGSTNYLTHYTRAFIAAGIRNRIIALYDNDSAGLSEIEILKDIPIPSNVKIMHLPDLEMCNHYPTIGPEGFSIDNINGRACSIEMFLGKDILKKSGEYEPIRWKAYLDKVNAYQGEIVSKSQVLKEFEFKLKRSKNQLVLDEWEEFDLLLKEIFDAFTK